MAAIIRSVSTGKESPGVPWPAGTQAGDLVCLFIADPDPFVTNYGWSRIDYNGGFSISGSVIAKIITAADLLSTVELDTGGGTGSGDGVIAAVSFQGGWAITDVIRECVSARTVTGTGELGMAAPPTSSAPRAGDTAVYFIANVGESTNTSDRGTFLDHYVATDLSHCSCAVYVETLTADGVVDPTFTLSDSSAGYSYYCTLIVKAIQSDGPETGVNVSKALAYAVLSTVPPPPEDEGLAAWLVINEPPSTLTVSSAAGLGKTLDIGSGSAPSGWQDTAFDDSAWTPPVVQGGAVLGLPVPGTQWTTNASGNLPADDKLLFRVPFTLASAVTLPATLVVAGDNIITGIWVNGVLAVSPGAVFPPATFSLDASLFSTGANVIAFEVTNLNEGEPPSPISLSFKLTVPNGTGGLTNRTPYLHMGGAEHSFTLQLRQRGQATCSLYVAAEDDYAPTRGTQMFLYDQTEADGYILVFSGIILNIDEEYLAGAGDRMYTLTGVSFEYVFDTVLVPPGLYAEQTAGSIVSDLLATLEAGAAVTAGTIMDGAVIPRLVTNYEKISDVLNELATASEFVWAVDPATQQLNFAQPSSIPAPFTLASDQILWSTCKWKQDGTDYRNRQLIRMSFDAFAHSAELFVGAGQKTFTLMRPVNQVTNVWTTKNTQNHATGTFTGLPAAGDTITISFPSTGSIFNWTPTSPYAVGQIIVDPSNHIQKCTSAGTSGGSTPPWDDLGGTTTEGTVTWQDEGTAGLASGQLAAYTFVTALDNRQWGQVLIGATAAACAQNLCDAINATSAQAAVTFSLPTWENPLLNADAPSGGTITVRNKNAGQGYVAALSEACTNFSWSGAVTSGGITTFGTDTMQVGVAGTTTQGLAYTPGSAAIAIATPLNVGSNLQVEYTRAGGDVIAVENTGEVIARAAIEHGTGKYQVISNDSGGLVTQNAAAGLLAAQQALAAYSVPPQTFSFDTHIPGLSPGQFLAVALTYPTRAPVLMNGNWVVQEVSAQLVPVDKWIGNGGGHYRYTVRVINIEEIGSYLDFWEGLGGGGVGGGSSSGMLVATGGGSQTPSGTIPATRLISTTAPLTGGGDLSADRTLAISTATTGALGVVKPDGTSITISAGVISAVTTAGSVAGALGVVIDGGGSAPATGSKGYLRVPYNCTITSWTMIADVSGSAVITVKACAFGSFPSTASIVASAKPTLTSAQSATSSTLTGWTTTLALGDVLEFNLDSVTTCTRIILELQVTKT